MAASKILCLIIVLVSPLASRSQKYNSDSLVTIKSGGTSSLIKGCLTQAEPVGVWQCDGRSTQKWQLNTDNTLQAFGTSTCLELKEGANTAHLKTCDSSIERQKWFHSCNLDKAVCFVKSSTKQCLQEDKKIGVRAVVEDCDAGFHWSIQTAI